MKKVSLVVLDRERDTILEKLREAGLVHLKKKVPANSAAIPLDLLIRQAKNRQALSILSQYPVKKGAEAPFIPYIPDDSGFAEHIIALTDEKILLQKELPLLTGEKRRVESWGEFNPEDFAYMEEHGVKLHLYSLPLQIYKRVKDKNDPIVVSMDKHWVKVVAVGEELPRLKPFPLPEQPLSEIISNIDAIQRRIEEIENSLSSLAFYKSSIIADNSVIADEIEFETARAGMETLDDVPPEFAIAWLSGFVPGEKIDELKTAAVENGWTLVWDDPSPEDRPPTLLKNNSVIRIIQPLFSLLGTMPGYWEYDISLSYMVFLSLFFAMIFGDAGYGLVLLVIALALGFVFKKKSSSAGSAGVFPDAAKLVVLLASCTMVWGSITGSWFAIPVQKLPAVLRLLIIPPFNSMGPVAEFPLFLRNIFNLPEEIPIDDLKTKWYIQFLCFTIGMFQLIYARGKNFKKLLPSLAAVAQLGWIFTMTGIYFLVLFMLLKMQPPFFTTWFIAGGLAVNFIFAEQRGGNFFINILKSLTNFFSVFLKAIGGFADIISYIRLFAVGMAGGMIAQTFNSMAIPAEGLGSFGLLFILKLIVAALVLVCGHALNLLMSTLSVIIHGVRLNLLEYAGNHLGMEWSGYAYHPFALRRGDLKNKE